MLERWLSAGEIDAVAENLELRRMSAGGSIDEPALNVWLGHELLRNYVGPGELDVTFRDLGLPEVADHLAMHKFPTDEIVQAGDFGEALGGALFRRADRWCVPVLKLRFKHRPNQPVQGADFVAFRLTRTPPVVAAPEVKTRTKKELNVGVKATQSLQQVLDDLPSSIQFIVARLLEQGSALAHRVARLLDEGYSVERHIVLVHDDGQWDERIVERLAAAISAHTEITVIRLADLKQVISRAYAAATADPARTARRRIQGATSA